MVLLDDHRRHVEVNGAYLALLGYKRSALIGRAIYDFVEGGRLMSDDEWRAALTHEQYRVLRGKGTERAFTGEYDHVFDRGTYRCAGCGAELFDSTTKFESGSGWPSFWEPANRANVTLTRDTSHGMIRTEVTCAACGGHLGHVFEDGPQPTGLRYCINSCALDLDER